MEDVLAQARGEKRPKPVERGLKKSPKKPKQEITDDNQHKEEMKKKWVQKVIITRNVTGGLFPVQWSFQ